MALEQHAATAATSDAQRAHRAAVIDKRAAGLDRAALLTAEELRRWRQPNKPRALFDISLPWVQVAAGVALYLGSPGLATFALAFALVAGGQHGIALVTHEFAHYLVFPNNRRLNDFIGTWLFGAPTLTPLPLFRHRHFIHHRFYSTDRDTKTVYRHDWRRWGALVEIVRSVTGYELFAHVLEARKQDASDKAEGRKTGPPISRSLPPVLVVQCALLSAFVLIDHWCLFFTLWVLPLVTLSPLFQKIRATMEHAPLDSDGGAPESVYFKGTPTSFVRSVTASPLERLFICKINFGYHAEHHLWSEISYQYLPLVRRRLLEKGSFADPSIAIEATYTSTILKLWRQPAGTSS